MTAMIRLAAAAAAAARRAAVIQSDGFESIVAGARPKANNSGAPIAFPEVRRQEGWQGGSLQLFSSALERLGWKRKPTLASHRHRRRSPRRAIFSGSGSSLMRPMFY